MMMPLYSYLAIAVILGLSFSSVLAGDKICTIGRYGTVTMFTGERLDVTLPCKYRLADVTCGNYRVKVTPGSAVDSDGSNLFSPRTLWVKVVDTNTGNFVETRTSLNKIKKYKAGKISNPWVTKEGSVGVVKYIGYLSAKGAAAVRTGGVFSVEFNDAQQSVMVWCSSDHFSSPALPDTLCGDAKTRNAIDSVTSTLFPGSNVTANAVVNYIVLNDDTVVQSKTCKDLASKFQSCEDKQDAAEQCQDIFGQSPKAQCLAKSATPLEDYYTDCMSSVCDGDASALDTANQFARDNCDGLCWSFGEDWRGKECDSGSDCGVANSKCINSKCRCADAYFYSQRTQCCSNSCKEAEGYEGFVEYRSAKLNCPHKTITTVASFADEEGKMNSCLRSCQSDTNCTAIAFTTSKLPWAPYKCHLCSLGSQDLNVTQTTDPSDIYLKKTCV